MKDYKLDFLGISETGRRDFSKSQVKRLSSGVDFTWVSRPPRGRSGGILLGVRDETMEILTSSVRDFFYQAPYSEQG